MASLTAAMDDTPNDGAESGRTPGTRLVLRLDTGVRIRREMARLYRSARPLAADVADHSRLANMLAILHRMHESGELEQRIERLEVKVNSP